MVPHQAAAEAVVVVVVVHLRPTGHHRAPMGHRLAPMVLHPAEDHPAPMEHHRTVVEDHPALMVHHQAVVEDLLALMGHLRLEVALATDFRPLMVHHLAEAVARSHRAMGHQELAVVAYPAAMGHHQAAAVSPDHLRLTVHLAPVVAVSAGKNPIISLFFNLLHFQLSIFCVAQLKSAVSIEFKRFCYVIEIVHFRFGDLKCQYGCQYMRNEIEIFRYELFVRRFEF